MSAVDRIRRVVADVADPEIPVLTIADLGVLRDVALDPDGRVHVTITPTYSGCPAMDTIRADIATALAAHGHRDVVLHTVLAPAWTTDWMSSAGRRKLREYGIAPPGPRVGSGAGEPVFVQLAAVVRCPRCDSAETRQLSRFSSTACKALYSCTACLEPFDHFKAL